MNSKLLVKSMVLLLVVMLISMSLVSAFDATAKTKVVTSTSTTAVTTSAKVETNSSNASAGMGKVCTSDVRKCPDGHFVSRNPKNNCAFASCNASTGRAGADSETVCCEITPVVLHPVPKYEEVPKSSCSVPEGMVGVSKKIVDQSLCTAASKKVCCKIEPVVLHPVPKYEMVPESSCSVPEGMLGISKEVVNDSFCTESAKKVCCKITPVVPNATSDYEMVPESSCSVPEGLLGVSKEVVADSLCQNNKKVCCEITPVVPNAVSEYMMVPESSCSVPEGLLGISKRVVNDSLCSSSPMKMLKSKKKFEFTVMNNGASSKQLKGSTQQVSVRLVPGSMKAEVKANGKVENINLSQGFSMKFNKNNRSQVLNIKAVGNWSEIVDESSSNKSMRMVKVRTKAVIQASDNGLSVELKNGSSKPLKVLPSTAALKAQEALKANNFDDVVLEEKGGKLVYQMQAHERMKVFGLFPVNASLSAEVDADSGDVLAVSKPWYSFFSSKPKVASVSVEANATSTE